MNLNIQGDFQICISVPLKEFFKATIFVEYLSMAASSAVPQ